MTVVVERLAVYVTTVSISSDVRVDVRTVNILPLLTLDNDLVWFQ